jgi:predicted RNase H-like HicB family nuclease
MENTPLLFKTQFTQKILRYQVSVEIPSHKVFVVYFYMREFIIYQDDDDKWVAECKELPGYRASGKTKDEALQKIKGALLIYHPCRCED